MFNLDSENISRMEAVCVDGVVDEGPGPDHVEVLGGERVGEFGEQGAAGEINGLDCQQIC